MERKKLHYTGLLCILHSGCFVADILVAWLRSVRHQRILLAVFFSHVALVCLQLALSKCYGESIVYSFRMKIFKDALKKCYKKPQQSSEFSVPL